MVAVSQMKAVAMSCSNVGEMVSISAVAERMSATTQLSQNKEE
jgi:hypothetical protein